ncbi:TIGR03503 family protein [uncultured Paraglaciecola sp.]|uniref:TIGR03503 family protein n=1 Tax=uncultured Paraglaciecola sp. TaxID=1765024 RepID=UPI0026213837|nr:TIGR03503 family protein [uncultured Paraglaciecola sp.]
MLIRVLSVVSFWLLVNLSFSVQSNPLNTKVNDSPPVEQNINEDASPITQLGTKYHNSIALLQNRFRIDFEVDEITMIFFREYGSAPIVLVRPDGSKIFQSSADGESVFWFDSTTYDMISIKNPTPGPWQAVGKITPESRVMVVSDLALHADPLPNIIFSGEILKQTAYLTNNNEPIDYTAFRDVVELTISLSSTNNPDFNNFGAKPEIVAFFEDNGKGMDERPLDGVFTGQFNLAIADGEWIPTFSVATPMYTRNQVDPKLRLLANPINIDIELDEGGGGYHKLKIDAQREHVNMSTLLIDGKVRFPNGDIHNFSITEMSDHVREHLIVNFGFGVYRVKLTAYGTTLGGREFILDVPEYSFLSEEPEPVPVATNDAVSSPQLPGTAAESEAELTAPPEQSQNTPEEKMSTTTLVMVIVSVNLVILILGIGVIWYLTTDKKPSFKKSKESSKQEDELNSIEKPGFFEKIFKRKHKAELPEQQPKEEAKTDPGFMDLSIPKE